MPSSSQDLLEFAEQLISVLERGRKSATYKYAVLLALMDLCLTTRTETGAAPTMITTVQLAERIVELYWPHARPFVLQRRGAMSRVLRQNSRGQAEIVSAIQRFREEVVPNPNVSLARARIAHPVEFAKVRVAAAVRRWSTSLARRGGNRAPTAEELGDEEAVCT